MKKETAMEILNYNDFRALDSYVADRVSDLYKLLEQEQNIEAIRHSQGAIQELRRLLKIREVARNVLKQESPNGRAYAKESSPKNSSG